MNPPEPKGVHPLFIISKDKMDSIMKNYKKDPELEKEFLTTKMENYVRYFDGGQFEFKDCEYCNGPLLGHIQPKCPKIEYDERDVNKFKNHLKNLGEFDTSLRQGYKRYKQEIHEWTERGERTQGTTEIRKTKQVPIWTGYKFETWKAEIEGWCTDTNQSEQWKYQEVIESLKKNNKIQDFVNNTLIDRIGETKTVKRVLDVLSEKYEKSISEKIMDVIKKISGEGYKAEENVDKMLDKFEQMMAEIEKVKLAQNLNYAMGLQFLDRIEKCGKINNIEKMRLKDFLEDEDGKPREGETLGRMKKELKRMRVTERREDPFKEGLGTNYVSTEETYYVRNGNDYRSRRDNWSKQRYIRSESKPGYMRTASRGNYVRDDSKFRRGSYMRPSSAQGRKFDG